MVVTQPIFGPMEVIGDKWWILLVSMAVALVATPVARRLAYKHKVVDRPDDLLKPHGRPVAYLGGLAICAGLLAGLASYLIVMPEPAAHWQAMGSNLVALNITALIHNPLWRLTAIALASILITIVGLLDDVYVMKPRQKVGGQVVAACILLVGGIADQTSLVFLEPLFTIVGGGEPPLWLVWSLSVLLCVIIVVAACNATNLLDGMDGLCGGVTGIIALGFLALAVFLAMWHNTPSDQIRMVLCLAMAGGVLGFLPYNLPPASIFMGDAGSMLLGFFVAMMLSLFTIEITARWFLAACVVFSLPILDTGLAVIRRTLAGKSIFAGDRSHLYDQLVDRGMTVKQVVSLFYVMASAAAAIGVVMSITLRLRQALPIYLILLIATVLVFYFLGMMSPAPRKTKNADQTAEAGKAN